MHKTQCLLSALGNDSSHSLATFQFTKHLLLLKHFPTFHTHSDSFLMIPILRLGPKQEPAQGSALGKPERHLDIPPVVGPYGRGRGPQGTEQGHILPAFSLFNLSQGS